MLVINYSLDLMFASEFYFPGPFCVSVLLSYSQCGFWKDCLQPQHRGVGGGPVQQGGNNAQNLIGYNICWADNIWR